MIVTVVHLQDMKENMFAETEPAQALKEIRFRDPDFDMVRFLYNLKVDVPIVIQAYLKGQVDVLKQHCSNDMVERLSGIIAAQQAQVCICLLPCTTCFPFSEYLHKLHRSWHLSLEASFRILVDSHDVMPCTEHSTSAFLQRRSKLTLHSSSSSKQACLVLSMLVEPAATLLMIH